VQGQPVTQFAPESGVSVAMTNAWERVKALADELPDKN